MKVDFKIEGYKQLEASLKRSGLDILKASKQGLYDEGEEIFEESQLEVPVDTGALKRSGYIEKQGNSVNIGYGRSNELGASNQVPKTYMVAVHERLDVYHPNGKAKFLEDPVNRHTRKGTDSIAAEVRKLLHL